MEIQNRLKNGFNKKMMNLQSDEERKKAEMEARKLKFQMKLKDGFTKTVNKNIAEEQKQMKRDLIKLKLENNRRKSQMHEQALMMAQNYSG